MKKGIIGLVMASLCLFAVTLSAQEVIKKTLKKKGVKAVATFKAKDGTLKKVGGKTDVVMTLVAAGQDCADEGKQEKSTSKHNGSCSILGEARPCVCEVEVTFECQDGQYRGVDQHIKSCEVDDHVKVPGANNIPDRLSP